MADTRGYEVVVEGTSAVLLKALQGAWKSAECPGEPDDEGRIPEFLDIPPGTMLGGYTVAAGHVQIPRDELGAELAPDVNGAELTLGLHIQTEIEDPPVPAASLFTMQADVRARVPLGTLPGSKNVGLLFANLPRASVSTVLTSGDPLAPKLAQIIREFFHKAYENGSPGATPDPDYPTIPHNQDQANVTWGFGGFGSLTVDTHSELYDDLADPASAVEVTLPQAGKVQITIPMYLRIYRLRPTGTIGNILLRDPMAVRTRLVIVADVESPPGLHRIRLDTAAVTSAAVTPAPGTEGTNYTANKAAIPVINLDTLVQQEIGSRGTALVHAMGPVAMAVPTVAQIEQAIGDVFHTELESRGFVAVWTPEGGSQQFDVRDVATKVLADAFAIAINASPGSDPASLPAFVPAGREFAIAMAGPSVQTMIDAARTQNGFADSDLPKRMREDDKDVDLTELDVVLAPGAIRMTGEVTVIDAVLGSIDVDADFRVDVGLHWEPSGTLNADGVQRMVHHIIGEPDVDPEESVAFWIIAIILAVISFGAGSVLIAIVIIVVAAIVASIAAGVGGGLLVDGVTGAVSGITAWPPELSRIGTVRAVFSDPIDIDTSGLVMAGTLEVVSSCESVQVVAADSGSAYSVAAAAPVELKAQRESPVAAYAWAAGDGAASVASRSVTHTYLASGTYVAKHTLSITQPGGATSRHFATVDVRNVPPVVDAGADLVVNEGEVVNLSGRFTDVEFPDTHESMWFFGDAQQPDPGTLSETNTPPQAEGTSSVTHAWCDDGIYEVTLRIRDQNGGIGEDTRTVTVLNVPPAVEAGPDVYAYPCSVITLTAGFTDPGWCDTHTGAWDFGVCAGQQMATVAETHEPPEGRGTVIASHTYEECGSYLATSIVRDDDGEIGQDTVTVHVVDVVNKDFEGGFRERVLGRVANGWEPYLRDEDQRPPASPGALFAAEQDVVHDGQRAQAIRLRPGQAAGIWQRIGANPGWTYEIRSWYSMTEGAGAAVRLGLDPTGGTDPAAGNVVWVQGSTDDRWRDLTVRADSTSSLVTIFVEAVGGSTGDGAAAAAFVDGVTLLAIQQNCPVGVATPPGDGPAERVCLSFRDDVPESRLEPAFERDGFAVRMLDHEAGAIVPARSIPGSALELRRGVLVGLPFAAATVEVTFTCFDQGHVFVTAVRTDGGVATREVADCNLSGSTSVSVWGHDLVEIQVGAKGTDAGLISVCVERDEEGRMGEHVTMERAREVLEARRAELLERYAARGVGLGKGSPEDPGYVLTVYLDTPNQLPAEPVTVDEVPVKFVVTGQIKPLSE